MDIVVYIIRLGGDDGDSSQIDDDVQRHNELLEVIRGAQTDISALVARRRKDFTKEFFMHLHTVAESYYDNPNEQNGTVGFFFFLFTHIAHLLIFCRQCISHLSFRKLISLIVLYKNS